MTAALHLSPLVASGLVRGPVDVYESSSIVKRKKEKCNDDDDRSTTRKDDDDNANKEQRKTQRKHPQGGKQPYPGSGASGRDIGVGIWSTAWWPFLRSLDRGSSSTDEISGENALEASVRREKDRRSYKTLLQDLEACGSYVRDVGYRTPDGGWLVKSELNASPFGVNDLLRSGKDNDIDKGDGERSKSIDDDDPALLFVREKDLLSCLRNAIRIEQRSGTVRYHSGVRVEGITDVEGDLGSLVLRSTATNDSSFGNVREDGAPSSSPRYHLIIAADGLHSPLRSRFAGHRSTHVAGTGIESSRSGRNNPWDTPGYGWEHGAGQREATQVEDREYVVFRGNAPRLEVTAGGGDGEDDDGSFQTWGEERSMRFAAVPFRHETEDLDDDDDDADGTNNGSHYSKSRAFTSKKQDEEVWFATTSDPVFVDAYKNAVDHADPRDDAEERKQSLLEAFGSWHRPVKTLIGTTPAREIMYELAVAHRHNAGPVFDVGRIMEFEAWQERTMRAKEEGGGGNAEERIDGRGPALVFIGDAFMTVDPVLAQGFTIAMVSGASIVESLERILAPQALNDNAISLTLPNKINCPNLLRDELTQRHHHV